MTPQQQLQNACIRAACAQRSAKDEIARRDKVIRRLAAQGMTPTMMSRLYPLTQERFDQIVFARPGPVRRRSTQPPAAHQASPQTPERPKRTSPPRPTVISRPAGKRAAPPGVLRRPSGT